MTFIFYVNRGLFIKFDPRIENESISALKQIIEKSKEIPIASQVILVSGGDEPPDNSLIGECYAGSEENNPIYLFRKVDGDQLPLETIPEALRDVRPLQERVSSLMNLQPSYNTVQQRVRLSKDFNDHAKVQMTAIRRLVKEQHMMSQGWYVALANLDEKCERIRKRYADFQSAWQLYVGDRESYEKLIVNFESHMDLLQRIRLPDALVESCCDPHLMAESSVAASQVSLLQELHQSERRLPSGESGLSLLDWISSFDKRGSLAQVLSKFRQTLERVNAEVAAKIAAELPDALALANENAQEHRVVQGLEKRLTQMSHYQNKAEARLRSQAELMSTLASNLERLERERDASVVGELCKQHKRVLLTMAENHKKQTEAVQFALNGKNDFMGNLHMRFAWLTRIEMMLIHQETYFMTIFKRLREMRIYREILHQAKAAAPLYAQALAEMVRRREFAHRYLSWASGVVDTSLAYYEGEAELRKAAAQRLDKHFLLCLFRALKQLPSKFATKAPFNVDASLPELSREDLEDLRVRVPELAPYLALEPQRTLPDPATTRVDALSLEERSVQAILEEKAEEEKEKKGAVLRSGPICVPSRPESEPLLGASSTGSPFVEMQRCAGEEEEVFSSALLNLEESQRVQSTQTEPPSPSNAALKAQLQRMANEEISELRRQLSEVRRKVKEDMEAAQKDTGSMAAAVAQMAADRAALEAKSWRERQVLSERLEEASLRIESLKRELQAASKEGERANLEAEQRCSRELDLLQRNLLLEHEVALETERGRHASERQEVLAQLREAERKAEWAEEKVVSLQKERGLLERAAEAEKKVYEAELIRLREELDAYRTGGTRGRRSRRVSVSSDSQQHILEEFPRRSFGTKEGEECELMEDSDLDAGWVKKEKEDVIHEQDQERIAQLEEALSQRDSSIQDLRVTVDRLSQQVMRDREQIRQLRANDSSGRPLLSTSPQLSRSPPVLEQPAPISSSFLLMAANSPPSAVRPSQPMPVTSPPKSAMPSSSMTESAISSASTSGPPPSSPAPGGPGRELESPPMPNAMMASATSASAFAAASVRGIKLVLSLFRSGDRVLLLRNPSTGLWFMLSTDGWSYFVHNDCFATLDLSSDKFYMFAEFKSKERCLARKNKNRFSLPAGNYFFRIKARPLRSAPGQPVPGEVAMAARIGPEVGDSKVLGAEGEL